MLTPRNNFFTTDGWKNITELKVGDEVLTTNFAGHGIFSPILNITEYDYDGYIYEHVDVLRRHGGAISHFSITEGSVLPIRKTISRKSALTGEPIKLDVIDTINIDDLYAKGGSVQAVIKSPLQFTVNSKRHKAGVIKNGQVDMSDVEYFKLLAHAIFKGYIYRDVKHSITATKFRVAESDDPTYLLDLLDRHNIPYRTYTYQRPTGKVEREVILRSGAGSARALKKFIRLRRKQRTLPKVIMQSTSPDAVMAFLVEMLRIKKKGWDFSEGIPTTGAPLSFAVSNMTLAEQLADLFYKVGFVTTIEDSGWFIHLIVNRPKFARIKVEDINKIHYKGKVYSVDVINEMAVCNPTHLGPRYSMVVKIN